MKRLIISLFLLFIATISYSQSLLKDGIRFIPHSGGLFIGFEQNNKIGFALNSSELEVIIEPKFDDIYVEDWDESDRMILVAINGKWGAVDCSLNTSINKQPIIPCIYESMTPFRNGISKVLKNGRSYFIDKHGNEVKNGKK